jgi:hypothetical protein
MFTIEAEVSGPLFEDPDKIMREFTTEAVEQVASQGLADWHILLDLALQHPTGYYEAHLTMDLVTANTAIDSDRQVVYGPWLEGTGSRNDTTQFKGYNAARMATQQLQGQVDTVLAPAVAALTRRLNGA